GVPSARSGGLGSAGADVAHERPGLRGHASAQRGQQQQPTDPLFHGLSLSSAPVFFLCPAVGMRSARREEAARKVGLFSSAVSGYSRTLLCPDFRQIPNTPPAPPSPHVRLSAWIPRCRAHTPTERATQQTQV